MAILEATVTATFLETVSDPNELNMNDKPNGSLLVRFVALPMGLCFIALPFVTEDLSGIHIMAPVMGGLFILYSIGGLTLLTRLGLDRFTERAERPTGAELASRMASRIKRTIIGVCVIALIYLAIRWLGWIAEFYGFR